MRPTTPMDNVFSNSNSFVFCTIGVKDLKTSRFHSMSTRSAILKSFLSMKPSALSCCHLEWVGYNSEVQYQRWRRKKIYRIRTQLQMLPKSNWLLCVLKLISPSRVTSSLIVTSELPLNLSDRTTITERSWTHSINSLQARSEESLFSVRLSHLPAVTKASRFAFDFGAMRSVFSYLLTGS